MLEYTLKSIAQIDGPAYAFGLAVDDITLRQQCWVIGNALKSASSTFEFDTASNGIFVDDRLFESAERNEDKQKRPL